VRLYVAAQGGHGMLGLPGLPAAQGEQLLIFELDLGWL